MPSLQEMMTDLQAADAAGDEQLARRIADVIRQSPEYRKTQAPAPDIAPDEIPGVASIPEPGGRQRTVPDPLGIRRGPSAAEVRRQTGAGFSYPGIGGEPDLSPVGPRKMSEFERQLLLGLPTGIARGISRAGGGVAQVGEAIQEALGIPGASVAGVTARAKQFTESLGPAEGPAGRGAEFLGEQLPYALAGPLKGAGFLRTATREGALGGAIGGAQFIEDPEAAGLSPQRTGGAALGAGLGAGLPAAGQLLGLGADILRPAAAGRRAAVEGVPASAAIEASEEAVRGIPLAPAAAGLSERKLADLGRSTVSDPAVRDRLEAALNRGRKVADKSVSATMATVLPEGAPTAVRKEVSRLIESVKDADIPENAFDTLQALGDNPAMQMAYQSIARDARKLRDFEALAPTSVGRLDMLRKELAGQMGAALRSDKPEVLQSVPAIGEALDAVREIGRQGPEAYRQALNMSQREHIIRGIGFRMGLDKKTVDDINEFPADEFYKKFMKSQKAFNTLKTELTGIADPQVRTAALAKAEEVRRYLNKIDKNNTSLEKIMKASLQEVQQRAGVGPASLYTAMAHLRGQQNAALIDYIIDAQAQPGMLRKALQARDPRELGQEVGIISSRLGAAAEGREVGGLSLPQLTGEDGE